MAFELVGQRVVRQARAEYEYTPLGNIGTLRGKSYSPALKAGPSVVLLTVPDTIDDDGADMEAGTPAEAVIDDDDDDDDDNSQPRWLDISQRRASFREKSGIASTS